MEKDFDEDEPFVCLECGLWLGRRNETVVVPIAVFSVGFTFLSFMGCFPILNLCAVLTGPGSFSLSSPEIHIWRNSQR